MNITNIENHISWKYSHEVKKICEPMFQATGINYFDYARFYKNGNAVLLYTDPAWVKTFLNEFSYKTPPTILTKGAYLWSNYLSTEQYNCAIENFKHKHGITIVNTQETYDEVYNFSGPSENRYLVDFYLNNLDFLKSYRDYFVDKAANVIEKVTTTPLIILPEMLESEIVRTTIQQDYIQEISQYKLGKHQLTKREYDCVNLLKQGLSAKLIARDLNISPKTVEKHFENIKSKLNCRSNIEIISYLSK